MILVGFFQVTGRIDLKIDITRCNYLACHSLIELRPTRPLEVEMKCTLQTTLFHGARARNLRPMGDKDA